MRPPEEGGRSEDRPPSSSLVKCRLNLIGRRGEDLLHGAFAVECALQRRREDRLEDRAAGGDPRKKHLGTVDDVGGAEDRGVRAVGDLLGDVGTRRSEEHTSELQSLMRISYAVFCLKKKKNILC